MSEPAQKVKNNAIFTKLCSKTVCYFKMAYFAISALGKI